MAFKARPLTFLRLRVRVLNESDMVEEKMPGGRRKKRIPEESEKERKRESCRAGEEIRVSECECERAGAPEDGPGMEGQLHRVTSSERIGR